MSVIPTDLRNCFLKIKRMIPYGINEPESINFSKNLAKVSLCGKLENGDKE